MILPNVRASFGRVEAMYLTAAAARNGGELRDGFEERLRTDGFDAILDDPRTLNAVLTGDGISAAPAGLVFYLLARHALLEGGIYDRLIADYVAALLIRFGDGDRARRIDDQDGDSFDYLVDLAAAIAGADDRRAFLLRSHLGNFALWLSGLYPDFITARVHRRGAPGIRYYEEMGATGYQMAADSSLAEAYGLEGLYRACALNFPRLRVALNRVADRYLFPSAGDPVDRLLRQVADEFRSGAPRN